ncbi:MAG: hypothetical protein C5B56_06015, partial [Proteobacteria bacterium]
MKRKKPSKAKATPSLASPEIEQIEQLIRFMDQHSLEEFEFARADVRIRLRKPSAGTVIAPSGVVAAPERAPAAQAVSPVATPEASAASATAEASPAEDLHLVKSPIVGTFYGAPSPGADAFVKIGAHVE